MQHNLLTEGMREGDLADLVLPLISCDEYTSKIDESEAIVFGFYVDDEAAAQDLNRFLQKSAVPLLGTEVSPAPDQHGYFMVFVELMNNERLGENMDAILHELSTLVDIDEWHLRIRATDGLVPFTVENLESGIKNAQKHTKKTEVVEYLQASALQNAEFAGPLLILEGANDRFCFDFIEFDRVVDLIRDYRLEDGVKYDLRSVAKTNKITRMLGENWEAARMGQFVLLCQNRDSRGLLLKL
jgi:hypothetical protein